MGAPGAVEELAHRRCLRGGGLAASSPLPQPRSSSGGPPHFVVGRGEPLPLTSSYVDRGGGGIARLYDTIVHMSQCVALPDDLEVMPPGPELAAVVATVDRSALDAADLLRVARARQRLVAHQEAQLLADLHRVARAVPDDGRQPGRRDPGKYPWAETETAFALQWTHGRAAGQLMFADDVIDRLPELFAALDAGEIDVPKARLIVEAVAGLDDEVARRIVDKVLAKAPQQTTGELRARLRRLVLAADPQRAAKRARREVTERRVQAYLDDNHLATLSGYELAPHRVAAAVERLDAIAKAAKSAGDGRRIDQIRADAFLDLLVGEGVAVGARIIDGGLGGPADTTTAGDAPGPATAATAATAEPRHVAAGDIRDGDEEWLRRFWLAGFQQLATTRPGGCRCGYPATTATTGTTGTAQVGALPGPRRGVIDLQVPLTTLMGLTRLPGEVAGWGPVVDEIATAVARDQHDATWRYSVYDSFGELAHHGIARRRPAAADAAFVQARDRTCRAPGCRRAARGCDLDHTVDWQHRKDSRRCNLACLCRRHHRYKHESGAQLVQLSPGVLLWQSPLGPQYVTHPDTYLNQLDPPRHTVTTRT